MRSVAFSVMPFYSHDKDILQNNVLPIHTNKRSLYPIPTMFIIESPILLLFCIFDICRLPVADRVRQKRSTMQDMARPLKHWLCKHRNNPYPSKADKQQLAIESHMSLTQVCIIQLLERPLLWEATPIYGHIAVKL